MPQVGLLALVLTVYSPHVKWQILQCFDELADQMQSDPTTDKHGAAGAAQLNSSRARLYPSHTRGGMSRDAVGVKILI